MAWEPERTSIFFFSPVHQYAVTNTYVTEISLNVTLRKQYISLLNTKAENNTLYM